MTRALVAVFVFGGCAHSPAATEDQSRAATWTRITVADGSANRYQFTQAADGKVEFVYEPVTPEQSSTGRYSGGPPRKEEIDPGDPRLTELWAMLRKLEADPSKHTPDRSKGTGAIGWDDSAGKRDFIVQMGDDLDALLVLLKRFGR